MRVYEFARNYGMTSKELVAICHEIGIEVKAQSKLDETQLATLSRHICRGKDTNETIETTPVMVVKKDNTREYFDREKIKNGLIKSCEKRPVSIDQIESVVSYIENQINKNYMTEVETRLIGEMIMDKLKDIDEVSYVRFASVYRQFKDINTFVSELKNILMEKGD